MKQKYRILEKTITDGTGKSDVIYFFQKRFLWYFWIPCRIDVVDFDHYDYNYDPPHVCVFSDHFYNFQTKEDAMEILEKVKNPYKETYKGAKIRRIFSKGSLNDIYVNESKKRILPFGYAIGYEFSESLDQLKKMVDNRKITKKIKVI